MPLFKRGDLILSNLLIVSIFFDSYSVFKYKSLSITLFMLTCVFIAIWNVAKHLTTKKVKMNNTKIVAIIFIMYVFLNFTLTGCQNIYSCIFLVSFFCVYVVINIDQKVNFKLYSKIMDLLAMYGLYQCIGRIYKLPLSNLYFDGYMVDGFNWTNTIYGFSIEFERANAIFREPSFFSQFLAINILLHFVNLLNSKSNIYKEAILIFTNLLALIATFSGTGIIILILSAFVYYVFIHDRTKKITKYKTICCFLICAILFSFTPIGQYLWSRTDEIIHPKSGNLSGYMRFIAGYELTSVAWEKNFLLGNGIGTGRELLHRNPDILANNIDNGLYKISTELGIIGTLLWMMFLIEIYKKSSDSNKIIAIAIFPLMISHESSTSNYFWFWLYLISMDCYLKGDGKYVN